MENNQQGPLMDHEADGIKEYDNDLPRWWLYGFYFTIIMSVIYMFYYHVYGGGDWNVLWYGAKSQEAEYAVELAEAKTLMANAPKGPSVKMTVLTDAASLEKGKEIFNGTNNVCFTCHRDDLGGQVGPNLTDEYWIHGCSLENIITSIKTGFPEKGMIPYGSNIRLTDEQLLQVASFVLSKKGTNPPEPKPIEPDRDVKCETEGAVQ